MVRKLNGSVTLTEQSQQKLRCRFFRQPTNKIVPTGINARQWNADIALYVSYEPAQYRTELLVPAGTT